MELIIVKLTKNIYLFLSHAETLGYRLHKKRSWPGINSRIVKSFLIEITLRYIGIEQEDKDQAVSSLGL
ncbi:hypothetical protein ACLMQE_002850 [Listeria monocytogenes]